MRVSHLECLHSKLIVISYIYIYIYIYIYLLRREPLVAAIFVLIAARSSQIEALHHYSHPQPAREPLVSMVLEGSRHDDSTASCIKDLRPEATTREDCIWTS
jgi:hypothetical protein